MKTKKKARLSLGEIIAVIIVAAAILIIFIGIFSPDNDPVYIFTPQPAPEPPGTRARYVMNAQGHWQPGDSVYDAASQAKLIALTNAFYDTSDEEEHYYLTEIANDIRENAGLAGDDCLIEEDYVIQLGQLLDDAVKNGELSKASLIAMEKPYVESVLKTNVLDQTVAVYTFGKVDIEITRSKLVFFGSRTAIVHDVTLTTRAHYNAYFIYNVGWEADSIDAVNAFKAAGIPLADIGTASITTEYKFTDSWNSIDLTSDGLNVPYVIIDSHATPSEIDGETYRVFSFGLTKLQDKHIDHLVLLGCNAGHMDFDETNPAAAFSKKIYGGFVLASDGTVFNIGTNQSGAFQYESRDDDDFQNYMGTNGRSSLGWVVYRNAGNRNITYSTLVYTYTISDILDYFKPIYY